MERFGLHNDQWDRIKDVLPGREGMWAARRTIIDCSSKPFSTDLERAVPGVICPRVSATSRRSINVSADGRKAGFSSVFSSC